LDRLIQPLEFAQNPRAADLCDLRILLSRNFPAD